MPDYGLAEGDWCALSREVEELLTGLLRVDTTNPPGNETACALVLRDYLAANGIESALVGELPERQNLVASLEGTSPGKRLTLRGHMDVVPADVSERCEPPFAGVIKGGYDRGCGAVDMRGQVAAEAVIDGRILPGMTLEEIARTVADTPDAVFAAIVASGFTDSRWGREAYPDCVAYGFAPFLAESPCDMDGGRDHQPNERIAPEDVAYQALFFERLAEDPLA